MFYLSLLMSDFRWKKVSYIRMNIKGIWLWSYCTAVKIFTFFIFYSDDFLYRYVYCLQYRLSFFNSVYCCVISLSRLYTSVVLYCMYDTVYSTHSHCLLSVLLCNIIISTVCKWFSTRCMILFTVEFVVYSVLLPWSPGALEADGAVRLPPVPGR